eukprot:1315926-Amorphochlora_amoeboformis.AAC.1
MGSEIGFTMVLFGLLLFDWFGSSWSTGYDSEPGFRFGLWDILFGLWDGWGSEPALRIRK